MKRQYIVSTTLLLLSVIAVLVVPGAIAQDQPFAGIEVVTNFMASGTYDRGAEDIESGFEDTTGIDLEIVASPWDVLNQNNITDLVTGTGEFDVISGEFWIASVWDHMRPLEDFVERDNYGGAFVPQIWSQGPSSFYDDQRIGIPYSAEAYGIVYNTAIFEEAGIDANWETWDDFLERLDILEAHLEGTDISPTVFAWGAPEQTPAIFLGMYDGYLLNSDGEYALDAEKAVPALEKMVSLLDYNPEGAAGFSIDDANAVFLNGNAATMIAWVGFVRAAAQDPDQSTIVDSWSTSRFPGPGFPFLSSWNLFISEYSDNPEAAWEWIKFYTNPENAKQRFLDYGVSPPYQSIYEDPELLAEFGHDFPAQVENLNRAQSAPWVFEAFEAFFRNMSELVVGSITAENVVERTQDAWADITVPPALVQAASAQGQMQEG